MHLIFHFANSPTHTLSSSRDALWQMCPSKIELTLDTAANSLFIYSISHNEKSIKCHHCIIKKWDTISLKSEGKKRLRLKSQTVAIIYDLIKFCIDILIWQYLFLLLNCRSENESQGVWLTESQEAVTNQVGNGNRYIEGF